MLEYDEWLEINYDELLIQCAESGANDELDFDFDEFCEERYNGEETKQSG